MARKGNEMNQYTEVDLEIIRITDLAILFTDGDKEEVWIPKELIGNLDDDWEEGDTEFVAIPIWLAEKEGLV
jgi:hypothetical protein